MNTVQPLGRDANRAPLRITLCDISSGMTEAWLNRFFGVEAVEILQGDLVEAGAEAVVAPANSFGDMSGSGNGNGRGPNVLRRGGDTDADSV